MARQITYSEARSLALSEAKRVLRELYPVDEDVVFEKYVVCEDRFWIFFRNREIRIPDVPNGQVSDNCAFAVGKHGFVLTVADNLEDREELERQVQGLSGYFAGKDRLGEP